MDVVASDSNHHDSPRLGIVALDSPIARALERLHHPSADDVDIPVGFVTNPGTWPWPVQYRVVDGVDNDVALQGRDGLSSSVQHAVASLEGQCDLIVGNCGFFWRASTRLSAASTTPVLLSALDVVDVATRMSSEPVGVLTYSEADCAEMLAGHPAVERLRIVGYGDLPAWKTLLPTDWVQRREWSVEALRDQFIERTDHELTTGRLVEARVIVLECTVMPQFRKDLRQLTRVPIFDILALARSMLD